MNSIPLTNHSVRHARPLNEKRMVEVEWEDGGHSLYPFTWLRDNCQCPLCYLESAQGRKLLMADIDVDTGVKSVDVTNDSKVGSYHSLLSIFWSGGFNINVLYFEKKMNVEIISTKCTDVQEMYRTYILFQPYLHFKYCHSASMHFYNSSEW